TKVSAETAGNANEDIHESEEAREHEMEGNGHNVAKAQKTETEEAAENESEEAAENETTNVNENEEATESETEEAAENATTTIPLVAFGMFSMLFGAFLLKRSSKFQS